MPVDPHDYEKNRAWYLAREKSAAGKEKRRERNQARQTEIKAGKLSGQHDPREVDHKVSLDKGGSPGKGNLQVISRTANRKKYNH